MILTCYTPPPTGQTRPPNYGRITGITSLDVKRKYNDVGEMDLHCAISPHNLNLLKQENILHKRGDETAYIIKSVEKIDMDDQFELSVIAYDLSILLKDRYNLETRNFDNVELDTVVRALVGRSLTQNNLTFRDSSAASYMAARNVPHFVLGPTLSSTPKVSLQDTYGEILSLVTKLCQDNDIGFKTVFDRKTWTYSFQLYRGLDRTINQTINQRCIFSKQYDTILGESYLENNADYKNVAFVMGEGEDDARIGVFVRLSGTESETPRELVVDARDLQKTEGESDNSYKARLKQRGLEKLTENKNICTATERIQPDGKKQYKKDWDLGDLVTCMNKKWGYHLNTRIPTVEEVYDSNGATYTPTLGNDVPTQNDKIKKLPIPYAHIIGAPTLSTEAYTGEYLDLKGIPNKYDVGDIYISTKSTSPASKYGGTWQALGGKFLFAAYSDPNSIYYGGKTGGEATNTLTGDEIPKHRHSLLNSNGGAPLDNSNYAVKIDENLPHRGYLGNSLTSEAGGGKPHNNMPPYLCVYMWERLS
ncbi:MAG: hypothetical protein LKJ50_03970 [Clostridiales bacterium]|nr:hypothetical protein [Clostridiales bacterium]MCI1961097.1 hypothetical protein [Clostridiales bacterium]MCI2021538.1 hypothetical protein [Clostridiales bacterium]MCI2026324.1 hypothetical protein [Clostridiales bacterium]